MVRLVPAAVAVAVVGALCWAAPADATCEGLMPAGVTAGQMRDITARDLIRMRNVGAPDGSNAYARTPLAVSPDGRSLAFVITRSDPDTNSYCQALAVVDLARRAAPRIIDRGGERIATTFAWRGAVVSDGWPAVIVPLWSPDGRSIGYLKRTDGVTQVWVAAADGSGAHDATRSNTDVEQWRWLSDGRLIFSTDPGMPAAERAIDVEGQSGWLYDDRLWLGTSPRPLPVAAAGKPVAFVTDGIGAVAPASEAQRRLFDPQLLAGTAEVMPVSDARGWTASALLTAPSPASPSRVTVVAPDGRKIVCAADACSEGIISLWWSGRTLLFLRREGWEHEETALYRWTPGAAAPTRVMKTNNAVGGCTFQTMLYCTSEASATPRTIVAIDVHDGKTATIFEPNPEFRNIQLGSVQRLRTRNRFGLPAWADLVLPPGYVPGTKLPMIVTQYRSRGFVRGATGDEYPIFLMAARGYAVLSTNEPPDVSVSFPDLKNWDEINAIGLKDWNIRRNTLSSLEIAVDRAIATGAVDPARIGITGLSDGSATVQFALINTKRFAAAAMSTCCMEPTMAMTQGTALATFFRDVLRYPPLTAPDAKFWAPMSLRQNAARIDVPILIQEADREYPQAIEAFMALREQHKPVEMYVYPDEYHNRAQPRHRLATYERSIDWFDFWLRGREDPAPEKTAQYQRWRALRDQWRRAP